MAKLIDQKLIKCFKETIETWRKIEELNSPLSFECEALLSWIRVMHSKVKLNTDGAAKGNLRNAGAGYIFRDLDDQWLIGVACNLGITVSVNAELWGVLQGLAMAWNDKFRHLILEVDSQVIMKLLTKIPTDQRTIRTEFSVGCARFSCSERSSRATCKQINN